MLVPGHGEWAWSPGAADAIDRLPAQYRAVLMLRDVEECSNEEVAETLGETFASVKSRLHRARMALREMLTVTYAAAAP